MQIVIVFEYMLCQSDWFDCHQPRQSNDELKTTYLQIWEWKHNKTQRDGKNTVKYNEKMSVDLILCIASKTLHS